MSTERHAVRLRRQYTGEGRQAALAFYRRHGMHFGLVPDTHDPQQRAFEAAVLHTLARPHPALGPLRTPEVPLGLAAASPGVESLVLWPHPDHLTDLLLHLLPTRADDGIAGLPALRAATGPYQDLVVRLVGRAARITIRATGADLERARAAAQAAGREPLWDQAAPAMRERHAWSTLVDSFAPGEAQMWSRALRRPGLANPTMPTKWAGRAPSAGELEGPKPQQLLPHPIGPLAGKIRGTVAVTPAGGRGGVGGCTTVALHLAGALARSGTRVVVLADGKDAASPLAPDRHFGTAPWYDLVPGLPALRGAILPDDREEAHALVERARAHADVVIVDTGNGAYPHLDLAQAADLVLAVTRYDQRHWIADTETIDRRPKHVQMWAWLDQQYLQRPPAREVSAQELMLAFLDVLFADWVGARKWEDASVYWEPDWDLLDELLDLDVRDIQELPAENEEPALDRWRAEFLAALDAEGTRRHRQLWQQTAAAWSEHNRRRNRAGLQAGDPEPAVVNALRQEVLATVETEAIARWGAGLWREHRLQWAIRAAGDEPLFAPYEDLIEHVAILQPSGDIADRLLKSAHDLPTTRLLITVNRVHGDIDPQQLAGVDSALREHDALGVTFVPRLLELGELPRQMAGLAATDGAQAAAGARLAVTVADLLSAIGRS